MPIRSLPLAPALALAFALAPLAATAGGAGDDEGTPSGAVADAKATPVTDSAADLDFQALRGQVVYLDFWASWCAPCRQSFPWMNSLQERFGEEGLTVIGVSVDRDRKAADAFLKKHPAKFRIVYDPEGTLAEQFDLQGMPSSFLFDRMGEQRAAHVGFRASHTEGLENAVRALLSAPARNGP